MKWWIYYILSLVMLLFALVLVTIESYLFTVIFWLAGAGFALYSEAKDKHDNNPQLTLDKFGVKND